MCVSGILFDLFWSFQQLIEQLKQGPYDLNVGVPEAEKEKLPVDEY